MQKVKVGFQKDAIPQKMQKTAVVVGQITGNAAFPKAQPMLADVTASVDALNEASQAAQSSQAATKQLFEVQNQKLADLDAQLAALCNDVNVEANGDETALMSSGFEMAKDTATAAATPGAVTDFSLTRGDLPGVVDGHCHTVKNARAYESRFIVAAMPEGDWTSGPTFFNFEWTGLVSGSTIWVEVRASGTAGAGPWSDACRLWWVKCSTIWIEVRRQRHGGRRPAGAHALSIVVG